MKKEMETVSVDRGMVELMTDQLYRNLGSGAAEVCRALERLESGETGSLLLELGETGSVSREACIRCGGLQIWPQARKVTRDGKVLSLTPKEYDILVFLARNRGQVFTKEQIYQAVWADSYMLDSSNVMAFIRKLRKKIEPNPDAPRYILTIWGIGYKFSDEPQEPPAGAGD